MATRCGRDRPGPRQPAGAAGRRQRGPGRSAADRHRRAGPAMAQRGGSRAGGRLHPAHQCRCGAAAGRAGRPSPAGADHRLGIHRFGSGLGVPRPRPGSHGHRARPGPAVRSARRGDRRDRRRNAACGRGGSSHRCLGAGVGGRRGRARAARAALRRQHARRRCGGDVVGVDPQRRVARRGRAGGRVLGGGL